MIEAPPPAPPVADPLELLAAMSRDFAVAMDIEATLRPALGRIAEHLNAEGGALFLLDDDGSHLTCRACFGPVDITGLRLKAGQGIVGRVVAGNQGEVVRDVSKDPSFQGAVDEKTGFRTRSILCAPMSVKDTRIGAIEMVNKRGGDGLFTEADLHMLAALSTSAGMAILNARMAAALVEQERVRRELELAAEIQRTLLPRSDNENFPVQGVNRPARTVSGDFFDFMRLGDGRIMFCLGDVSGKGMDAALLMAKTASLFHCLGKNIVDPGRLMKAINVELCETASGGRFVTMVCGRFDPDRGAVRLANAGHEPPLFFRNGEPFVEFPADTPPLGLDPEITGVSDFPEVDVSLAGGTLYVFTDGLTEGRLPDGTMLGTEGLRALLTEAQAEPLARRLTRVLSAVDREGGVLRDDLTILAVEDRRHAARNTRPRPLPVAETREPGEILFAIRLPASADRLKYVRGAIHQAALGSGCDEAIAQDVVIAVDEACQNIIRHAYQGQGGDMEIEVWRSAAQLVVRLRDFAAPIDPSQVRPRDLDDVRPGGLGTHFIRSIMDNVEFLAPPGGERGNILRLAKAIGSRRKTRKRENAR